MKTIMKFVYLGFAVFALAYFVLLPTAEAVVPPPDGGYPGANTAEGQNALFSRTTGGYNTAVGYFSLRSDTTGSYNTGLGVGALLLNNGDSNTAVGAVALLLNTTGAQNTAVGTDAMVYNDTGTQNTAVGASALYNNTTESFNTAIGVQALFSNTGTGGHYNVATGYQTLYSNTTGRRNVANGSTALYSNTTGNFNTAQGDQALYSNTNGIFNTAIGFAALYSNVGGVENQGSRNTAIGFSALGANTTGSGNTAIGVAALNAETDGGANTAVGNSALVSHMTGNQNIVLGFVAGQNLTDGCCNIYISDPGVGSESATIRIGNVVSWTDIYGFMHPAHGATYIAGINGQTASGGVPVYINSDGKLGTLTSSARFKTAIKPMDESSEAILALEPVTFRYKHEIDPKGIPQFGLVAEDVEKINPDLVSRDRDGKPYTVRYEAVNAMLLNEFLKEHRKVEQLTKDFEFKFAEQQKQIEALTAGLQKVSAQVETSRPAPQMVDNRQ